MSEHTIQSLDDMMQIIATAVLDAYDEWILSPNAEVLWFESRIYLTSIHVGFTKSIDIYFAGRGERRCFEQQHR